MAAGVQAGLAIINFNGQYECHPQPSSNYHSVAWLYGRCSIGLRLRPDQKRGLAPISRKFTMRALTAQEIELVSGAKAPTPSARRPQQQQACRGHRRRDRCRPSTTVPMATPASSRTKPLQRKRNASKPPRLPEPRLNRVLSSVSLPLKQRRLTLPSIASETTPRRSCVH